MKCIFALAKAITHLGDAIITYNAGVSERYFDRVHDGQKPGSPDKDFFRNEIRMEMAADFFRRGFTDREVGRILKISLCTANNLRRKTNCGYVAKNVPSVSPSITESSEYAMGELVETKEL